MHRLLRAHLTLCASALALACSSGTPPSKGDDVGTGGSAGGSGGAGASTGATAGVSSGGGSGTGTGTAGGAGGSGASGGAGAAGGAGGAGGSVGGGAGSGASGGAGGSAGSSPQGGQGGSAGGTTGTGGAAGAGMSSGGMPMGGSGGDTAASGGMGAGGSAGGGAYSGTVILKDDFDAASTLDAKWFAYPDYDMTLQPKIDTARVHSPPNALKVSSSSNGAFIMNPKSMDLPTSDNKFYARVWINFEQATSMISGHAAYLVGAVSQDNSGTELRLGMSSPGNGGDMMDLNLQNPSDGGGGEVTRFSNGFTTGGNPGDFTGAGFKFDANKWYCLEALFDGGGSEFRVWVDSTEIMEMHVHDFSANNAGRTMWGPKFNYIKIGGQNFSGQIGQIWYDDVIIGSEQVGCTL